MLVAPSLPATIQAADAFTCTDVHVVWARGSAEGFNGVIGRFFDTDLRPRLGTGVSVSLYQLGEGDGFAGFDYPAIGDLGVLGAPFPALPGNPYYDSVAQGREELDAYLAARAAACPHEVYVLGGWSQGAEVIGDGLFGLTRQVRDRIAFVALFGDPKLLTGNRLFLVPFSVPVACRPDGLRPWIRGSSPCWIAGGALQSRDPYVPSDMELRVGSWCTLFDGACDGSQFDLVTTTFAFTPFHAHFKYFEADSDSARAAREATLALQIFLPAHAAGFDVSWFQFVSGATGADLAFVFDTTGSMSGSIDDAKAQASELARAWLTFFHNGRVALVQYRDQGDSFVTRLELPLTNNVADFQTALDGLSADEGGDTPEALLSGVMTALDQLDWRDGATKAEIVITDAPGKDPEPVTGFTRDQVATHAREIDPVAIYAVDVSGGFDASDFLAPLASATAGAVFVLEPGQSLADTLFAVLDAVHFAPVATLNGPYVAVTGDPIRFRTEGSFDADAHLVSYEWDFNSDGTVDQTTTSPTVDYTYPGDYHGLAAVRVISSDGGSAIATAQVTVDAIGFANLLPIAPVSASASITGTAEATVTWTPAANDRADGYQVFLADGTLVGLTNAGNPTSVVIRGLDLSRPVTFHIQATNGYGNSADVTAPVSTGTTISALGDAHGWLGLPSGDDQGTQFDLQVELLKNGSPVATGIRRCITGVARNPQSAKEAVVPWSAFSAVPVTPTDVLGLRFSARIGTNPDGTKCSGPGGSHTSAIGLRLYYDASSRNSRFAATIGASPSTNLYLRSDGGACDKPVATRESQGVTTRSLNTTAAGAVPAKCKDSGGVQFAGGNKWSTISTWYLTGPP